MDTNEISGLSVDVVKSGSGPSLVFLPPEQHVGLHQPFVSALAEHWQVQMPHHPGFDRRQPPEWFRTVGDLAYLYLDWIERFEHKPVVVGASLGAWIALEMAVRNARALAGMVLIGPVGVKFFEREVREYTDVFALPDDQSIAALFVDAPDFGTFSVEAMTDYARERQYTAYYAWKPYFHDPVLGHWLHRATVPSLVVSGDRDGFVNPNTVTELVARLPSAAHVVIDNAGHYPQIEQPDAVAQSILQFSDN